MPTAGLLAALDLGSNMYRVEFARMDHQGRLQRVEYLKETVRQGGGLDAGGRLSQEAMERGWACLTRFAARLRELAPQQVRAVATQTLREARNGNEFLAHAETIVGCPITVISGEEEARLIYQGVVHLLPSSRERRLVVDIGGRSTEVVLGCGSDVQAMDSLRIGSVAWSLAHLREGTFSEAAFARAAGAAHAVLQPTLARFPRTAWDCAYGSSGTAHAVADVLAASGRTDGTITREALSWMRGELLAAGHASRVQLPGLQEDRRPVIGGGLAVLQAVFDALEIDTMRPARGALRHGVLCGLAGIG